MKKILLAVLTMWSAAAFAQNQQTLKGTITDKESRYPLAGVTVAIISVDPVMATSTDANGEYKLTNVPCGRHLMKVSHLGYKDQTLPNVVVGSGKESVVDFQLVENAVEVEEVTVKMSADKTSTNSEMAVISARSFNMEEAMRYAGALNDPSRMAANFAGVSGANDGRNDIIIRGNSPLGLLWRLEGIEIPNPNHFGSLGSSGGPVSMLNSNLLGKSDFMTGAFPANFGNATSGVFDLALRKGNSEKREHLLQMGFNGIEAGTEGPFKKGGKASYLINYRYSTLGVFNAIGIDVGTGSAVPQYQDINFKVHIPTKKMGTFGVFGLGGLSWINLLDSQADTTESNTNFYNDGASDVRYRSNMGVVGAHNTFFLNERTSIKTVIAQSATGTPVTVDTLYFSGKRVLGATREYEGMFETYRTSANLSLNSKINRRLTVNTGVNIDRLGFYLKDRFNRNKTLGASPNWQDIRNSSGSEYLSQVWAMNQLKVSDRFTLNTGLHAQLFSLNNSTAIEPRVGARYTLSPKVAINAGSGVHNQTQPIFMYFNKDDFGQMTNKNMGFTRSTHFVLGTDITPFALWRFKVEGYYQYLDRIPVEKTPSSFSMVNVGSDFNIPDNDNLENKGTAYNVGGELTTERFFGNGFYILNTISIFDSKYKASDGKERNTAYNGNYVVNLLGGYEVKVSKKGTLTADLKGTLAGGRRVTPIDVEASRLERRTIYRNDEAYSERLPTYFRTDLRIGYRIDGKKTSHQISLLLNNVTNQKNVFSRTYDLGADKIDPADDKIKDTYQLQFTPIPQYRFLF